MKFYGNKVMILSRKKIEKFIRSTKNDLSQLNLISILEPDCCDKNFYPISGVYLRKFNSYIIQRFYDSNGNDPKYPTISKQQAEKLADFIHNHKNEKFVVHCGAGISRSAGVAMAVICITKFHGDKFSFEVSDCEIRKDKRFFPNLTVFDRICEQYRKKFILF